MRKSLTHRLDALGHDSTLFEYLACWCVMHKGLRHRLHAREKLPSRGVKGHGLIGPKVLG